jgi:hypothetical protein
MGPGGHGPVSQGGDGGCVHVVLTGSKNDPSVLKFGTGAADLSSAKKIR